MPADMVLAGNGPLHDPHTDGWQLTAFHARMFTRDNGRANDRCFEYLLSALLNRSIGPRIRTLEFVQEPPIRDSGYEPGPNRNRRASPLMFPPRLFLYRRTRTAFAHLTTIRIILKETEHSRSRPRTFPVTRDSYWGVAKCLYRADCLEDLSLSSPSSRFRQLFKLDPNAEATRTWNHLRMLTLEGVEVTSDELAQFVKTHALPLRCLTLRDCCAVSTGVPLLVAIENLKLWSFCVQGTEGMTLSADRPTPHVDEKALVRYINRKTLHNPLEVVTGRTSRIGAFLFATSFRKYETMQDLVHF